ncbi:ATP-binding protein [Aquabacter cavernae]|uniref:ATP-binding protein n=1 Tax=Aquabacter cavernae TaxID=2496029 RepID=UPI001FE08BA1|nr:ATP-binding protein [Aquabacter cavernae]
MSSAWDTLRVRVTVLLVGAILLVVSLASSLSFFFMGPGRFQAMDDAMAARIAVPLSMAEAAGPGANLGPAVRAATPDGHVVGPMAQGLGEALERLGFRNTVSVVALEQGGPPQAAVRLSDGRVLMVPLFMPPPPANRFWEMLFWFLLIAMGTAVATAFAIRGLTRPLAIIEDALAKVGPEGELPHIAERGTAELRAAARTINRLSERLKAAMESRMRIVAAAAHDLRTPMTRLRLRAEFLPEDVDREKWLQDLDELDRIADSAIRLVREEVEKDAKTPLALDRLAAEVAGELRDMALPAELVRTEEANVLGHPLALKRALRNLAINAATHGRHARLSVFARGEEAVLEVRDEGPGIPEALLARVFEPFFRVDSARQNSGPGTGLGLAIAREIVERHGGTLTISNAPEGGLLQVIRLPLAPPQR